MCIRDSYQGGQADFQRLIVIDSKDKTVRQLQIDRDTMAEVTVLGMLGNPVAVSYTHLRISVPGPPRSYWRSADRTAKKHPERTQWARLAAAGPEKMCIRDSLQKAGRLQGGQKHRKHRHRQKHQDCTWMQEEPGQVSHSHIAVARKPERQRRRPVRACLLYTSRCV